MEGRNFHFHIGGNIELNLISQVTMTYPVEFKLINFIIIDILIFLVMELNNVDIGFI